MFLFSNKLGLVEVLTVFSLVLLELLDLLSKLGSSGLEEVFKGIVGSLDVNDGILDALGQGKDEGVVFVGSNVEVEFEFI